MHRCGVSGRVSERPKGAANPTKPRIDHQAPAGAEPYPFDDDLSDALGGVPDAKQNA